METRISIDAAAQPAMPASPLRIATLEPWLNAAWVALGTALCAQALELKLFGPAGPESGLFPFIAGAMLVVSGIVLAFDRRTRVPAQETFWCEPTAPRRITLLVLGILGLLVVVRYGGFLIAGLAFMPVLLMMTEKRSIGFALVVGSVTTLSIYGLFVKVLGMPMPRGPLGF